MTFIKQIVAEHIGCTMVHKKYGLVTVLGVTPDYILCQQESVWLNLSYDQCTLALIPLTRVSDELTLELAQYLNLVGKHPSAGEVELGTTWVRYSIERKYGMIPSTLVDVLRPRGFDCGHREIESLIKAGMAIDKSTL